MSVNYYLSLIVSVCQLLFVLDTTVSVRQLLFILDIQCPSIIICFTYFWGIFDECCIELSFLVFLYLTSNIIFYPPLGKWMLHIPVIVIEVPRKSSTFMNIANKSTFISMTEGLYALRTYLHFFLQRLRWLQNSM